MTTDITPTPAQLTFEAEIILFLHLVFSGILPKTTVTLLTRALKPKASSEEQVAKLSEAIRLAKLHSDKFQARLDAQLFNQLEKECRALRVELRSYELQVPKEKRTNFGRFLDNLSGILNSGSLEDLRWWRENTLLRAMVHRTRRPNQNRRVPGGRYLRRVA